MNDVENKNIDDNNKGHNKNINNSDKGHNKNIIVKCELCGFEFKKCDGLSCQGCPLNCNVIKCPNCGYEILPESKSYKFMEDSYKKIKNKFFNK